MLPTNEKMQQLADRWTPYIKYIGKTKVVSRRFDIDDIVQMGLLLIVELSEGLDVDSPDFERAFMAALPRRVDSMVRKELTVRRNVNREVSESVTAGDSGESVSLFDLQSGFGYPDDNPMWKHDAVLKMSKLRDRLSARARKLFDAIFTPSPEVTAAINRWEIERAAGRARDKMGLPVNARITADAFGWRPIDFDYALYELREVASSVFHL